MYVLLVVNIVVLMAEWACIPFYYTCAHNISTCYMTIHSSAKLQSPQLSAVFLCSCFKVHHSQEVGVVLYLLCHIVP